MTNKDETLSSKLQAIIGGYWQTQAIGVGVRLEVFDHLVDGPKTYEQLAAHAKCAPHAMRRLMRGLAAIGVIAIEGETYSLTEMGRLLTHDDPDSQWAWAQWVVGSLWGKWANLAECVRTGESSRKMIDGTSGYEHVELDPELAYVFNMAMRQNSRVVSQGLLRHYPFEEPAVVVDVGGGFGGVLIGVLRRYRQITGILFDLKHALWGVRPSLDNLDVKDRLKCVEGDFFVSVPSGGDYYILKSIIHNWDDQHVVALLLKVCEAMKPGSKILCVERVLSNPITSSIEDKANVYMDLNMLVGHSGQERSEAEFEALFASARLRSNKVIRITSEFNVIEVVRA